MQNLNFISVQPLTKYYLWQCQVYGYNFVSRGIHPNNIHMVFARQNSKDLDVSALTKKGYQIHIHDDHRPHKQYVSSVRPYLLARLIFRKPEIFNNPWFYHDADIIFRELPNFDKLLADDIIYTSDTVSYTGAKYIRSKGEQFLDKMCEIVKIDKQTVIDNELNSGGAQYLMKSITGEVFYKIYFDCEKLFTEITNMIQEKLKQEPNHHALQIWTADMWAVLWNLWLDNKIVKISQELDFSWGSDHISRYHQKPILHIAGVTPENCIGRFYKIDYINSDPIRCYRNDPKHFDHIKNDNATSAYVEIIKEMVKGESGS